MKTRSFSFILLCTFFLTSCGLHVAGLGSGDEIWLDGPIEEETYVGTSVSITVHSNYELPEVIIGYNPLYASNMPLATVPMQQVGSKMYEAVYPWVPGVPGEYNLRAYSADGVISMARYIKVLPLPAPSPYPTPTPLTLPLTLDTAIPTTTLPSILPVLQFTADAYTLISGQCTFLRWSTVFVESAYLNGEPVELMHSRQVCPAATTTYVLHGDYSGGSIEESITINVTPLVAPTTEVPVIPPPDVPPPPPPPDIQGPSVTAISKSAESIFDGTMCGTASNTITATVTDTSGVSEVVLWYRAIKTSPAATGEWRSLAMTKTSGNTYQAVLGVTQFTSSLALYADGKVEFYITAKDSAGNNTQSGTQTFVTIMCLG